MLARCEKLEVDRVNLFTGAKPRKGDNMTKDINSIGNAVRRIRDRLHRDTGAMRYEDAAERLGCSINTIFKLRHGYPVKIEKLMEFDAANERAKK